jgi:hypothetical protein
VEGCRRVGLFLLIAIGLLDHGEKDLARTLDAGRRRGVCHRRLVRPRFFTRFLTGPWRQRCGATGSDNNPRKMARPEGFEPPTLGLEVRVGGLRPTATGCHDVCCGAGFRYEPPATDFSRVRWISMHNRHWRDLGPRLLNYGLPDCHSPPQSKRSRRPATGCTHWAAGGEGGRAQAGPALLCPRTKRTSCSDRGLGGYQRRSRAGWPEGCPVQRGPKGAATLRRWHAEVGRVRYAYQAGTGTHASGQLGTLG